MLHSRFIVRSGTGEVLGIFPAPIADHAEEIRALLSKHPGAAIKSMVTTDDPCALHPAYEVDNCPACGRPGPGE